MTAAPLSGITVIDCSRVLAGPYCGVLLSHLGADVIKVEGARGDESRTWPPHKGDIGATFIGLNANKRSIAVDLKADDGAQIIRDLARTSDVLIENFKTGDMERFGLGYLAMHRINPRLVYTSIAAFGRQGPKAGDLGYEALVQAYSGVLAVTGEPDGNPVRCGVSFLDMATGVMAALATVSALYRREATGQGGRVDTSLLETSMGLQTNLLASFVQHGIVPTRLGTAHPQVVPYQVYKTRDGYIFIATGNQNLFERFCRAIGREDMISDPRFSDNAMRVRHRDACVSLICQTVEEWDTLPLTDVLRDHGVPFSPVNDLESLMKDGQVDALGVMATGHDPAYGRFQIPGLPFTLSEHSRAYTGTAPRLGEHTIDVLKSLGYDDARIQTLLQNKVIQIPQIPDQRHYKIPDKAPEK
ncbi:MAG: CoA transferase [Proteobacteria bacterium]|nr:CoA transferase [Pseudomonadota bacterium]